ncbi:hypothetical protein BGZ47_007149 [Haplosporangium gracile]|nr:hypothetical protein BGZ47_007149 [Haplosporangium gracile]
MAPSGNMVQVRGNVHIVQKLTSANTIAEDYRYFYFPIYSFIVINSVIDLHRLFVAYRPTAEGAQLSFNIWSIGTVIMTLFYILVESYTYFVPEFYDLVNNATLTAEVSAALLQQNQSSPMMLPEQATPQSKTTPTLVETAWKDVMSWMPSVLDMVLGFALWTILKQRRQLDHEQEIRQEQQGHHLIAANNVLPAPVASASTVEGFKTEAEIRRSRLRVPTWPRLIVGVWFLVVTFDSISQYSLSLKFRLGAAKLTMAFYFLQSLAGLYILYRKSLILTQWLFYSICATTLHMYIVLGTRMWNAKLTELDLPIKIFGAGDKTTINELKFFRGMTIIMFHAFFTVRLWIAWRLVADLKARDGRVARAKKQQQTREQRFVEKLSLDDVVTERTIDAFD